jgi:Ribbon-helix-helix protein, copG family
MSASSGACAKILEDSRDRCRHVDGSERKGSPGVSVTAERQFLGFYVDEREAERLRELAAEADRSTSAELRRALSEYLERAEANGA